MAVDFSRYLAPGLYTESVAGPQVSAQSTAPTAIGMFGQAVGHQRAVESLKIDPDVLIEEVPTPAENRALRERGIDPNSVVVKVSSSGLLLQEGVDYSVFRVSTNDTPDDPSDDLYTIKRVIPEDEDPAKIQPGDSVEVTYRFTDSEYYKARAFFDYDDVVAAYGTPFDMETSTIQSELTLAARFAFLNGARIIVAVAVQPTAEIPSTGDYITALDKLKDEADISVVVPATGQQSIQQSVIAHVDNQSAHRFERRAVMGRDGSDTAISDSALISEAGAIANRRIALVAPTAVKYFAPELDKEIIIGGQYLAIAIAAASTTQPTSRPLTRRAILGFNDVVGGTSETARDLLSQAGLMVVEKTRRGNVRVRHGVTTDPTTTVTREWSIMGQQDTMIYRLRQYLDANGIIGEIIDDITLVIVKASVDSALQSLMGDRIIRGYQNLKVRQLSTSPDVVEVRYEWRPSLPLNYIVVKYSMDLGTGETGSFAG